MTERRRTRGGSVPDPSVRARVLEAFAAVVTAEGLAGATMDAIAEAAGVSKTTIYTRWSDRSSLIVDAFAYTSAAIPTFSPDIEFPDALDVILGVTADPLTKPRLQMLSEFRAAAGVDPGIARLLREHQDRWRVAVEDLIERGKRSGHVPTDRNTAIAAEVVMAVAAERQIMQHPVGEPLRELIWRLLTDERPY